MRALPSQWCPPLSIPQNSFHGPADPPWWSVLEAGNSSAKRSILKRPGILRFRTTDIRRYRAYTQTQRSFFVAAVLPQTITLIERRVNNVCEYASLFEHCNRPIAPECRCFCARYDCRSLHGRRLSVKSYGHQEFTSTSLLRPPYLDFLISRNSACPLVNLIRTVCTERRVSSTFVVHAEGANRGRNWWKRILFDPINYEDFLVPPDVTDNEFEAQNELDVPGEDLSDEPNADDDDTEDDTEDDESEDEIDRMIKDDAKFEAWKRRLDSRTELRKSRKLGRNPEDTDWEDWLDDSWGDYSEYIGGKDSGWYTPDSDWEKGGLPRSPPKFPERGMSRTMKEFLFRIFEREEEVLEDLEFEERVFRFTSQTTAKFVAVLVLGPWLVGYLSHDFLIVPFLNRYVETVPLAAEVLDVRESQKLQMIERLKLERQRVKFEAAIGKAPPLEGDELLEHIRDEALEMREELRLENRKAFANIWSDLLAGLTVFLLLVFNRDRVAIMQLTGNRLFTNISDTGKAFIIILLSDIFLGYHSESGWETVVEIFLEHYGFEASQDSIYLFVAFVPVTIDACFKLWVFRFLTRLSPSAAATFREMQRH